MGVPLVWILDPEQRVAYVMETEGLMKEQRGGMLSTQKLGIEISLVEVFSSLNRDS